MARDNDLGAPIMLVLAVLLVAGDSMGSDNIPKASNDASKSSYAVTDDVPGLEKNEASREVKRRRGRTSEFERDILRGVVTRWPESRIADARREDVDEEDACGVVRSKLRWSSIA